MDFGRYITMSGEPEVHAGSPVDESAKGDEGGATASWKAEQVHASASAVTTGGDAPLQSTSPVKDTGIVGVELDANYQSRSAVQVQNTAPGGDEQRECSARAALAPASGLHEHDSSPEHQDAPEMSHQSYPQPRPSEAANGRASCIATPKTSVSGDAENEGKQSPPETDKPGRAPELTAEISLRSTALVVEAASEQGPSSVTAGADVERNDHSDLPSSLSDTSNRAHFDVSLPDGQKPPPAVPAVFEGAERQSVTEPSQDNVGIDTPKLNSIQGEEVYNAIAHGFQQMKGSNGCISGVPRGHRRLSEVANVLVDAGLDVDSHLLQQFINTTAHDAHAVSLEELNVIACLLLSESPTTAYLRRRGALLGSVDGPMARDIGYLAPHVHLSRGQEIYLRSGRLDCKAHPAISRYMQKLDEHRRACEAAQQYHEARAARDRLRELRTQQAEVVLSNVHLRHAHELALVRSSLLAQRERHEAECADRVAQLEQKVVSAIEGLRARHAREVQAGRQLAQPQGLAPHARAKTLQLRRQEVAMAGLQHYGRAHTAKAGADALAEGDEVHASEVEATWRRLRREQLAAQHQREMQALLTRCTCQRDDLEKQLVQGLERHDRRCSAVVAELMRVHAREVSHLEYIVSGKTLAGKCSVVRDSTFRRVASVPML